jgi:hypothetical protein
MSDSGPIRTIAPANYPETLALSSAFQQYGDTLQTSSARLLGNSRVELAFDRETGELVGERTEFKKIAPRPERERAVRERSAPVPEAPPVRSDMYGIGLKISNDSPHRIIEATNLRDLNGHSINQLVGRGDTLESVNDVKITDMSIDDVELLIFGPENSLVSLALSGKNKRPYSIQVKRHLLVQFAMGLAFSSTPPYEVISVNEVMDPNDVQITNAISIGDQLMFVDGAPANDIRRIQQQVVFGRIDSKVRLTLKDPRAGTGAGAGAGGQLRDVVVKRHLPAVAWSRLNDTDARRQPHSRASSIRSGGGSAAWSPAPQAPPDRTTSIVFDGDDVTGEFI